jgi:hypothetical protein
MITIGYSTRNSNPEFQEYLKKLGAVNINVWYGGNGVIARCKKPK